MKNLSSNEDPLERQFNELKDEVQALEREKIDSAKLNQDQQKVLRERLYRMIDYAIGRHDWYDGQRHQFLQIGLALMAVGASLGALLVNLMGKYTQFSLVHHNINSLS